MNAQEIFKKIIRNNNYLVRDHRVLNVRAVPAAAHLDIIYTLANRKLQLQNIELRKVIFKQPVVTSEEFDQEVEYRFERKEKKWSVQVVARKLMSSGFRSESVQQILECQVWEREKTPEARQFTVGDFIDRSSVSIDMEALYRTMREIGVSHYEFVKVSGNIYIDSGQDEELMALRLSALAEKYREKFLAHPSFLDAATMAGLASGLRMIDTSSAAGEPTVFIPFCVDKFCVYRPMPDLIYVHSRSDSFKNVKNEVDTDISAIDVRAYDSHGNIVFEYEKLSRKRIRNRASFAKYETADSAEPLSELQVVGGPRSVEEDHLATDSAVSRHSSDIAQYLKGKISQILDKPILSIDTSVGFYDLGLDSTQLLSLVKDLESHLGCELYPTLLFEYSTIESLSGHLSVAYESHFATTAREKDKQDGAAGDNDELESEIALKGTFNSTSNSTSNSTLRFTANWEVSLLPEYIREHSETLHVVVLFDSEFYSNAKQLQNKFTGQVAQLASSSASVEDQLVDKIKQLFRVVKELLLSKNASPIHIQLLASTKDMDTLPLSLSGILKSACIENTKLSAQTLLMDSAVTFSEDSVLLLLENEAKSHNSGYQDVFYRENGARYVQLLSRVTETSVPPRTSFKNNGTYVVSGGAGGLGFRLALHIAQQVKANIILLGRSQINDKIKEQIASIEAISSVAHYYSVDVANISGLDKAFEEIRMEYGSICGIFHCAGVLRDQFIIKKSSEEIDAVLNPKIKGLYNLDKVSSDDKIDFLVAFSSVAAVTGNLAQSDYASANAFMDHFIERRARLVEAGERNGKSLSINWPMWQIGGMQVANELKDGLYLSTGMTSLPEQDGFDTLTSALHGEFPREVVLYGDAEKITRNLQVIALLKKNQPALTLNSIQHQRISNSKLRASKTSVPETNSNTDRKSVGPIAVVGISGRYPKANTLEEYYQNLATGRDCISGFPVERWGGYNFGFDVNALYEFGGFIDEIDHFDAELFRIPSTQAMAMDPQARKFIEVVFECCQDAGFNTRPDVIAKSARHSVGVFVGVFWSHYELFASANSERGTPMALGNSAGSIANMTSYCFDFHGPSFSIDSMCSSGLTSIHLACESILNGNCNFAIAGGVNLVTHPHKYNFLKSAGFLSTDGKCRSFGDGGDGFVAGEGVGAVLLTTVELAEQEGYSIYGIVKGSAINHNGRTSGFLVPDLISQARVIQRALENAEIDPRTVSYIEAHGTGTFLGDAIEITSLTRAFNDATVLAKENPEKQFCAIGSVKSNIGHCEAAGGIAALTKVLFQMERKKLLPSINSPKLNPNIDFKNSHFYVQKELADWVRPVISVNGEDIEYPRIAGISSFGAGGANAHVIVEEYIAQNNVEPELSPAAPFLITISAIDEARVDSLIEDLVAFLDPKKDTISQRELINIAYTLQVGREEMPERRAFVVSSARHFIETAGSYLSSTKTINNCFIGNAEKEKNALITYFSDSEFMELVEKWMEKGKLDRIADLWVKGLRCDWSNLYGNFPVKRVHLPTHRLHGKPYWIPIVDSKNDDGQDYCRDANADRFLKDTNFKVRETELFDVLYLLDIPREISRSRQQQNQIQQNSQQIVVNRAVVEWYRTLRRCVDNQYFLSIEWSSACPVDAVGDLFIGLSSKSSNDLETVEFTLFCVQEKDEKHVTCCSGTLSVKTSVLGDDKTGEEKQPQFTGLLNNVSPPVGECEVVLAEIWADVLNIPVDYIGRNVSFFQLGGDSTGMTRAVGRIMDKMAVHITVVDFYEHSSIEKLSMFVSAQESVLDVEQLDIAGSQILSPLQIEGLKAKEGRIGAWPYILIDLPQAFSRQALVAIVRALYQRHDALRLAMNGSDATYMAFSEDLVSRAVESAEYSLAENIDREADAIPLVKRLQDGMVLSDADVIRVVPIGSNDRSYLLVIVHYMIADSVSLDIIYKDIGVAINQYLGNESVSLAIKTRCYQRWGKALLEYRSSDSIDEEVAYWIAQSKIPVTPLDNNAHSGSGNVGNMGYNTISFTLSNTETTSLMGECGPEYGRSIMDFLLSSLCLAYNRWTKRSTLRIDLHKDGRDCLQGFGHYRDTVGQFSYSHPLTLKLEPESLKGGIQAVVNNVISEVSNQINQVPNQGIGYGVLRSFIQDEQILKIDQECRPGISLRFHGVLEQETINIDNGDGLLNSNTGQYSIVISVAIVNGKLKLSFQYDPNIQEKAAVDIFSKELKRAIRQCLKHHDCYLKNSLPNRQSLFKGEFKHHWNLSMMFQIREVNSHFIDEAIRKVLSENTGLRHTFHLGEDGIVREKIKRIDDMELLERVNLIHLETDEDIKAAIEEIADKRQFELSLEDKLLKFILFELSGDRPARLQFIVHHALIDGFSLNQFLGEFFLCYLSSLSQNEVPPSRKSDSISDWSENMYVFANDAKNIERELRYWESRPLAKIGSLLDFPEGVESNLSDNVSLHGHEIKIIKHLNKSASDQLLAGVFCVDGIAAGDVVVAAFINTLSKFTGSNFVYFDMVVSGRDSIFGGDVSNTIGWFAENRRVFIATREMVKVDEMILDYKNQLREQPAHGMGLNAIKTMCEDFKVRQRLDALLPPVEFSMNYVPANLFEAQSKVDMSLAMKYVSIAEESVGRTGTRIHSIKEPAYSLIQVEDGRMSIQLQTRDNIFKRESIEKFTDFWVYEVERLVTDLVVSKHVALN